MVSGIMIKEVISMKKNNLKILSEISQDMCNKMVAYQTQEKDVIILPRSFLDTWQREIFKIVADEVKNENH